MTPSTAERVPIGHLNRFNQELYPFQTVGVEDAMAFINEAMKASAQGETGPGITRQFYTCPTGTGKGSMQLHLHRWVRSLGHTSLICTPRLEVIYGYLERCGFNPAEMTQKAVWAAAASIYVTTPTRLRNAQRKGEHVPPAVLIIDEAHHNIKSNKVTRDLFAMNPYSAHVGWSACGWRGTPKGTEELREDWGEIVQILDIAQACTLGCMQAPTAEVVPLLDDDIITVRNGEFTVKGQEKEAHSRLQDLAKLIRDCTDCDHGDGEFDAPTMVAVPSTEIAHSLELALAELDVTGCCVLQDTKQPDRLEAFEMCRDRVACLIQINVVSEGVDLPWLKRIIDAKPSMSPVAWLQMVGRICRPGGIQPEYICTNRNLERHSYLFEGAWPRAYVKQAQDAFEGPSVRSAAARHLGLQAFARFKELKVPLADGTTATAYSLYHREPGKLGETHQTEYFIFSVPGTLEPLVARRMNTTDAQGRITWGSWVRAEMPPEGFEGWATTPYRKKLSDKQRNWWERAGLSHGLDPRAAGELSMRAFAALPVLKNLRLSVLKIGGA